MFYFIISVCVCYLKIMKLLFVSRQVIKDPPPQRPPPPPPVSTINIILSLISLIYLCICVNYVVIL